MKPSHCLIIFLTISVAVAPMAQAIGLRYQAKKLGRADGRTVKAAIALPLLATKKAMLLGHAVAVPLAVGE